MPSLTTSIGISTFRSLRVSLMSVSSAFIVRVPQHTSTRGVEQVGPAVSGRRQQPGGAGRGRTDKAFRLQAPKTCAFSSFATAPSQQFTPHHAGAALPSNAIPASADRHDPTYCGAVGRMLLSAADRAIRLPRIV